MYYFFYSRIMKLAHRFNWHYAKPMPQIEPDEVGTRVWCQWCGLRGRVVSAAQCVDVIRTAKAKPAVNA